jgi:hypothetical protein
MTKSDSKDTFQKLEQQHTLLEDKLQDKDDDNFDELYLPIWYFPSNVYYKLLGTDFILSKHKLTPDPIMLPLYQHFAEEILEPFEAFELKKKELFHNVENAKK